MAESLEREQRAAELQASTFDFGIRQEPLSPEEIKRREALEAARQAEYARLQALSVVSTVMAGTGCTCATLISKADEVANYILNGKPAREPVNLKPVEGT